MWRHGSTSYSRQYRSAHREWLRGGWGGPLQDCTIGVVLETWARYRTEGKERRSIVAGRGGVGLFFERGIT